MSADIAILQHQADAPAGLLLDVLAARGLAWQTIRVDHDEPFPDPAEVSLAVSLGSDRAADDARLDWVTREVAWLRRANASGTALLGLCFGAQSLALALGGGVERARRPERGWITVASANPALIPAGPWLAWHDDVIRLAPGADLLAHNDSGPQAFRAARHLGVQFHPEVTPEIVRAWAQAERLGAPREPAGGAFVDDGADQFARAAPRAHQMFERYLASVGGLGRDGRS